MSDTNEVSTATAVPDQGRLSGLERWREGIRSNPALNTAYRAAVGVVGAVVLVVGIILVPYPGPGWLIVLAGLAILASEFERAHRVLTFVKHYYATWTHWLGQQPRVVQGLFVLATAAVVLVTLWLLGTVSLVAGWFGWDAGWLSSPIFG
jgi:uncharacterized protein (TIGR02611 family)